MRPKNILISLAASTLALSLSACATAPPLPEGEHVGEEMKAREVLAFSVVDANPTAYFDQILLVEATAKAVCQNMGCWMQVEDEGSTAMVRWETGCGGKYEFPKDIAGRRILVQGSFYPKELTEEDAAHMEEEAGGDLDIRLDGYEFNASSVLVLPDASS